ncbi:MAG: hypothetical protein JNM79_21190 [Burkholderiales bacterium]|nr:hypothetical protein [Burkholderiales bacterium]
MPNQPSTPPKDITDELFGKAAFDVEHAIGMYATSYCTIPAERIYDKERLSPLKPVLEKCHIYLIGYTPRVDLIKAEQKQQVLQLNFEILGKPYAISYDLPDGMTLERDGEDYLLQNNQGEKFWPDVLQMQSRLSTESKAIGFEVKYIGQAYGDAGSRNALDRLLKHETLQKIALKGAPEGHRITLLLLEIQPSTQVITVMNPYAQDTDAGPARIKQGLDKLYNTSEAERVSLYEAALIRYFYPDFNKEFKDSFPSTNLKILQDCYEKDFAAVIAEICIDELPFRLWSSAVPPKLYHIAKHDLHRKDDRRIFFSLEA